MDVNVPVIVTAPPDVNLKLSESTTRVLPLNVIVPDSIETDDGSSANLERTSPFLTTVAEIPSIPTFNSELVAYLSKLSSLDEIIVPSFFSEIIEDFDDACFHERPRTETLPVPPYKYAKA